MDRGTGRRGGAGEGLGDPEYFAHTPYRAGHFDAVVGNVSFADVGLHDPRHNRGGHSLHNHCIIKSLALTRPGAIVAILTSRYTLDAQNPRGAPRDECRAGRRR